MASQASKRTPTLSNGERRSHEAMMASMTHLPWIRCSCVIEAGRADTWPHWAEGPPTALAKTVDARARCENAKASDRGQTGEVAG